MADKLRGGDLRSIGKVHQIIDNINNQEKFDALFECLFHHDRLIVMRAADAIEKITRENSSFLNRHKKEIFDLCRKVNDKELKWHLAQFIPRLKLNNDELRKAWDTVTRWAKDKTNSRIIRVNSIQGLFELLKYEPARTLDYNQTLHELEKENIPSINARIRIIRKEMTQ